MSKFNRMKDYIKFSFAAFDAPFPNYLFDEDVRYFKIDDKHYGPIPVRCIPDEFKPLLCNKVKVNV